MRKSYMCLYECNASKKLIGMFRNNNRNTTQVCLHAFVCVCVCTERCSFWTRGLQNKKQLSRSKTTSSFTQKQKKKHITTTATAVVCLCELPADRKAAPWFLPVAIVPGQKKKRAVTLLLVQTQQHTHSCFIPKQQKQQQQ